MHLGDFETDRWEILAVCDRCLRSPWLPVMTTGGLRGALWEWDDPKQLTLVVSLTDNAWERMEMNHPNAWPRTLVWSGEMDGLKKHLVSVGYIGVKIRGVAEGSTSSAVSSSAEDKSEESAASADDYDDDGRDD